MFRRIALKLDSVHKSKIALGSADVFSDLLFEDFRTGKLHFVAKSLEENELDLRFWLEIDRVEIEDVGFDGERVRAKGGTHADVGDGIEGFCVNRPLGDRDADLRDQLVVTCPSGPSRRSGSAARYRRHGATRAGRDRTRRLARQNLPISRRRTDSGTSPRTSAPRRATS